MYQKDGRMWDEIGDAGHGPEYVLCSPPIPTDADAFLNGDVTDKRLQRFAHTPLPDKATYYAWPRERQLQLEEQEWARRTEGVWFWNCGVPTYITGKHYFYLNYHRYAGSIKPEYREANREFYWVWQHCMRSPNCKGLFLHTRRRDGKTSRTASLGVEAATRIKGFRFGMQSKTGPSARDSIYKNEVLPCVKALAQAPWFMPGLRGKIDPANNLIFGRRSTTSRLANDEAAPEELDDLGSEIVWADSPANAFDSDNLSFYFRDEVAKEQLHDPYRAWSVVSRQFTPNGYVVGKGICATTTDEEEEDESAPAAGKRKDSTAVKWAIKFWDSSDHTVLGSDDEFTDSGMFRLFVPAYKGYKVDAYGRDTPEGRQFFEAARKRKKGLALLNEKRANPFTIEEAHLEPASDANTFHLGHISDAEQALAEHEAATGKPLVRRYNLFWADEPTRTPPVRAVPDENGRWQFAWLPAPDQLNRVLLVGLAETELGRIKQYRPSNTVDYSIGTDPVEKRKSKLRDQRKASKASGYVFRQHDPYVEAARGTAGYWPSHALIGRYNARPENPETYYEDMMKACHLFGTEIHPETQKSTGLEMHFEKWGYGEFLADRPKLTDASTGSGGGGGARSVGTAASTVSINRYMGLIEQFIIDYVGSEHTLNSQGQAGINDRGEPYDFRRQPFAELHADNKRFNPEKTQFNDDTVAEGYTLLHAFRRTRDVRPRTESTYDLRTFDAGQYFR